MGAESAYQALRQKGLAAVSKKVQEEEGFHSCRVALHPPHPTAASLGSIHGVLFWSSAKPGPLMQDSQRS